MLHTVSWMIMVCVLGLLYPGAVLSQTPVDAGDRFPVCDVNLVFPEDCYIHYHRGGRVIDVTRLPGFISDHDAYNDGTHADETTDALLDAYDWVVEQLKSAGGSSWNHHKAAYIIYLPEGTYLVNRPLIHRGDPWIRTGSRHENLYGIRFYGQNRARTILRLADHSPDFSDRDSPHALLAYTKHTQNNSISLNGLQNLTIHTGSGNPGAVGADFQGANLSFVRNVSVISGDGEGYAGLRYPIWPTQGLHCDIAVEGFERGIEVTGGMVANGPVFEYITLRDQKQVGFLAHVTVSPIRKLHVINPSGPAVKLADNRGHLLVLDSRLENGPAGVPAIQLPAGCRSFYGRHIQLDGGFGGTCISAGSDVLHRGDLSGEFVAGGAYTLFEGQTPATLQLPVEESPVVGWDPPEKWVSVESEGATGGDASDDTGEIQAAMDACDGESVTTVYFRGSGEYRISRSIRVPVGVRRIVFMWGGRIRTESLDPGEGLFKISDAGKDPLIIEDYFQHVNGNTGYFIDHQGVRPLVCRNLRGSRDFSNYRNTSGDPGNQLYLENVAHMLSEGCQFDNKCWARWINTETAEKTEFLNSGGLLWVLGYKCEDEAVNFRTVRGGSTEVLGGIVNQYRGGGNFYRSGHVFELIDSRGSFIASTSGPDDQQYDTVIYEKRGDDIQVLLRSDFPVREDNKIHIPLFAGYRWPLAVESGKCLSGQPVFLGQNYPNPFHGETSIYYSVAQSGHVRLDVFLPDGRKVRSLFGGNRDPGQYRLRIKGAGLPPGLLYGRLSTGDQVAVVPMLKLKKSPL